MNINDMTKNLDKNKLNSMLGALGGTLSKEDMCALKKALESPDLGKNLSKLSAADVNKAVSENSGVKKALSSNPELMKNLNAFLKK